MTRGATDEQDIQGEYEDVIQQTENVSDELEFIRTTRFTRVLHNGECVAILCCPGRYALVQNLNGTLEARCLKQS